MRMSPEGGAKSTGVDQWIESRDCAATEDTAVRCAFPPYVVHAASEAVARMSDDVARTKPASERMNDARRGVKGIPGGMATPVSNGWCSRLVSASTHISLGVRRTAKW